MQVAAELWRQARRRPALEILPRRKLRDVQSSDGKSAKTVGATAVSAVRLKVRMAAEAVGYAGIAVHIAVPAVSFRVEER